MNLIRKFTTFIMKDTGTRNESPKLIGNMRFLLLFLIINNVMNAILYREALYTHDFVSITLFICAYLLLFYLSYRIKSNTVVFCVHFVTLIWIYISVSNFGWGTGIQNYIIILLVLCFFSNFTPDWQKHAYAVLLVCFRLYLYFYCTHNTLVLDNIQVNNILQISNSIIIFFMIAIIMFIYSSESQTLENKLIEYNKQLMAQANTDALTGLFNRRRGREYLESLLKDNADNNFCVCICDIDFFKKVNDNYGHDVGDLVLLTLSSTLKTELDDKGFIARWGGEEFLLAFPNCNGDEAMIILENLRKKIKALQIKVAEKTISITVTFGLAEYDFSGNIDSVLKEADQKLYIGKEAGRDRIVF